MSPEGPKFDIDTESIKQTNQYSEPIQQVPWSGQVLAQGTHSCLKTMDPLLLPVRGVWKGEKLVFMILLMRKGSPMTVTLHI